MHFRIKTCREVRFMVLLRLESAGVVHFGDGEVINVIYHPRELSRQSGRVPVVLSVLVILLVPVTCMVNFTVRLGLKLGLELELHFSWEFFT